MSDAAELYERDFYAWTQDQAALLRAWPEALRPNALDIAHLAEEIEDLGGSEKRAAKSLIRLILIHALKLKFHPDQSSRLHWREEIRNFRAQIEDVFENSPSLRARADELAAGEWHRAARQVALALDDQGLATEAAQLRQFTAGGAYFDLDHEILDPGWLP